MTLRDFSQSGSAYSFLDVTLDVSAERLTRGATEIKLRPKSFQVLRHLAERAGRLVTREELLNAIWPDVVVTDESLTKCIADIRRALGDDSQQVIRTVARRGYIFTAALTTIVEFPRHLAIAPPVRTPVPPRRWAVILAVLLMAGLIAAVYRAERAERGSGPAALDYTPLTDFTNAAYAPAVSPDNRMLAFIRGDNPGTLGGRGEVFVRLLPDGEPVQLTHDGKNKMNPAFTPAGDRVTYGVPSLMTDPQNWSTWTVSVFGGEPKLLFSNASALTWISGASSPRVLFSQVDAGTHMSIVTSAENLTESRIVYAPAATTAMAHRSYISPDRKQLLVVEMDSSGWRPCRLVPFESGGQSGASSSAGRLVGPSPGQCSGAAWLPDGRWMYFSVNRGNGYHIWRQRFPNGVPEQVTFGATEEREIAFASDGTSFFTSVGTQQSTLWIHDSRGDRQITSEGYASVPQFSPDGRKLYYLLRSRANRRYVSGELWSADLETGARERLLPDFLLADYTVSNDGERILFVAITDEGDTRVWLASLNARTAPRQLSAMNANRAFFGADHQVMFLGSEDGGTGFLYRIRDDGTDLQKAFADPIIYVYGVSPDGEAVAAWLGSAVQILPTGGRAPITASTVCAAAGGENRGTTPPCVSWSSNGKYLYLNDRTAEHVYALPIPRGRNLPTLPVGGIASGNQAAAWPGGRVVQERSAFFGADPSVYAFFRVTTQRNIYRVRVPNS